MNLPLAALLVVLVAVIAASVALAAFYWAVRRNQFSIKDLNEGGYAIFDNDEPVGEPQDLMFDETRKKVGTK
jgi:cbb3-type cytochrome oxidase maturation protein